MKFLAEVLLIERSREVSRRYTYICNENIKIGQRVNVPFGRNSMAKALVVNIFEYSEKALDEKNIAPDKLKEIADVIDERLIFTDKTLEVANWIASETLCSEIESIELFFPKGEKSRIEKKIWLKINNRKDLEAYYNSLRKNANVAKAVISRILESEGNYYHELIVEYGTSTSSIIKKLLEKELLNKTEEAVYSSLGSNYKIEHKEIKLNEEQLRAKVDIENTNEPVLLYGITGSGKTEVYISLIKDVINEGNGAIILVPEISLTAQTISRFRNVFGDKIGVLHSKLTEKEKRNQWEQIKNGDMSVVIGARSALFAPVENIGIIIIDECHEDSYKSESTPKFDGVEVAIKMSEVYGAKLVLGTATPTIEQYYYAEMGRFKIVKLENRGNFSEKPCVEIVDMSRERGLISNSLAYKMQKALEKKEQCIIFLNRRGFSNYLRCNVCGHVHMCKNCDISLNYHKSKNVLLCHYCGYEEPFYSKCTNCDDGRMVPTGAGTQKIEESIEVLFPEAKVLRMDKDTTSAKDDHEKILNIFKNKGADILVGTQMIGKGLDFPNVTVVGVINADLGLSFPDYRSHEKTFSIINQVIGRAGRGEKNGCGVVQTFEPENPVYRFIENDDFLSLYEREIDLRKSFLYPPFSNIIRIISTSKNPISSGNTAQKLKDGILYLVEKKGVKCKVLGPTPCLINKVEGRYRWQTIIKVQNEKQFDIIKNIIRYLTFDKKNLFVKSDTFVSVDINPKTII